MPDRQEYHYPYPIILSDLQRHINAACELLKMPIDLLEIAPSETHLVIRIRLIIK